MRMDDNSENDFLTANEISECLRIPLNTIYRLTKQGVIKGVKIGKQWRYNKYDFEKYLADGMDSRNIHLEKYQERRAYPRMNCNFICKSKINIQEMKDFCLSDGHITNISAGGVFLSIDSSCCRDLLSIGDPIDIDFDLVSDLDGSIHNMHAKGRIVRKAHNGVGIKFRHIDERGKELIVQYVD